MCKLIEDSGTSPNTTTIDDGEDVDNIRNTDFDSEDDSGVDTDNTVCTASEFSRSPSPGATPTSPADTDINSPWSRWVSHLTRQGDVLSVDHIFFRNPSQPQPSSDSTVDGIQRLPTDWVELVYVELLHHILQRDNQLLSSTSIAKSTNSTTLSISPMGIPTTCSSASSNGTGLQIDIPALKFVLSSVFHTFDLDKNGELSPSEFLQGVAALGYVGEESAELTDTEMHMLMSAADTNQDGKNSSNACI
jgi:hypothetical protein